MEHDIATLFGSALREIRKTTTGTQDRWTERTGMSQSYLSAAERGTSGWESLGTICTAVEKAGVDPFDLFRMVLARVEGGEEQRELLALWAGTDETTRAAVLHLLRGHVSAHAAAR